MGDNAAPTVGKALWFRPLKAIQKLFFHTPLVYLFVLGSFVYHDYVYWPLKARPQMEALKKTSRGGRLFETYPD